MPASKKVVEVSISPATASIPLGLSDQLVAIVRFDDSTSDDVTAQVTWASSNPDVATVDDHASKGQLETVATGNATITATLDGVVGTALVTVAPAIPASLEVSVHPSLPYARNEGRILAVGAVRPFVARVTFTDGTVGDATDSAHWTSSVPEHAVTGEVAGHRGWVAALAPGPTTLTASVGDLEASTTLTVAPFVALDTWIPGTKAARIGSVGIDSSGRAYAAWSYQFSGGPFDDTPVLATASYAPEAGWSAAAAIDFGPIDDKPMLLKVAVNSSGDALLAWVGMNGIYASVLGPEGWQPARTIDSGTSPFGWYGSHLRVAVDGAGDGLLVWANANGDVVLYSGYDRATDAFSPAQPVPGVNRGMANSPLTLRMNQAGAAVLVWEQRGTGWKVLASRFTSGDDPEAGWQAPETLDDGPAWQEPSAAIDSSGRILVAWVDNTSDFPACSVYARRFDAGHGWSPQETLAAADPEAPAGPRVAVNEAGAIVVWRNAVDKAIRAIRTDDAGIWQAPETIDAGSPWDGDPDVLEPHVGPDGRMFVLWFEDSWSPFRVGSRRYTPAGGWEQVAGLPHVEHLGKLNVGGLDLAFNDAGDGVALWQETVDLFDGQFYDAAIDIFAQSGLRY